MGRTATTKRPSGNETIRANIGAHDKAALIERIKSRKKRVTTFVDMVHNDAVAPALAEAQQDVATARIMASGEVDADPRYLAAQRRLEAAESAYLDETTRLFFRALPKDKYEHLIASNPATAEQIAEAKEAGDEIPTYDVDVVLPELISLCSWLPPTPEEADAAKEAGEPEPDGVQPLFTVDEWLDLSAEWNQAEIERCWHACLYVNTTVRAPASVPKG